MRIALIGAGLQARRRAPVVFNSAEDEIKIITAENIENSQKMDNHGDVQKRLPNCACLTRKPNFLNVITQYI